MNRCIGYGQNQWKLKHPCQCEVADKTQNTGVPTDNMQFLVWPVHRTFARQRGKTETFNPCMGQLILISYTSISKYNHSFTISYRCRAVPCLPCWAVPCGLRYAKRSLMSWVVVVPKERRARGAAPALLLVLHRHLKKKKKKKKKKVVKKK